MALIASCQDLPEPVKKEIVAFADLVLVSEQATAENFITEAPLDAA